MGNNRLMGNTKLVLCPYQMPTISLPLFLQRGDFVEKMLKNGHFAGRFLLINHENMQKICVKIIL